MKKELLDAYEKLVKRKKIYEDAMRLGTSLIGLGFLLFILSVIPPIIPMAFNRILFILFGIDLDLSILTISAWMISFVLTITGSQINKRKKVIAPSKLSASEEEFINIIDALKNLDTYLEDKIDFLKVKAVKNISRTVKRLRDPAPTSYSLWKDLTKDRDKELILLNQNIKDRLIPALNQEREVVLKAYPLVEKLAEYLLNPSAQGLKDLNEAISELPPFRKYQEERRISIPFFEKHQILQHICIEFIFVVASIITYQIGIKILNTSVDNAFIAATALFGTLTAGYMTVVFVKKR